MSLFDELKADQRQRSGACKACTFIAAQPKAVGMVDGPDGEPVPTQDEWRAAFLDRSFSITSLIRAISKHGGNVGETPVTNHRKEGHK